jgi:hypothetical protein
MGLVFYNADDMLSHLQAEWSRDFVSSTIAHVYLLGERQRRIAAKGSIAHLQPIIARELSGYAGFRIEYRPDHAYGYAVRIECLNERQLQDIEAKRRLRVSEADLLAIILPTLPAAAPAAPQAGRASSRSV